MNIKYNTVLGLVVVVQQNSLNALLLRNIQLIVENSLPGIFMTNCAHARFENFFLASVLLA